jgi:hypothetical protein
MFWSYMDESNFGCWREPLPKFPERKSDLKTLPKILEDILVKIRTNYMYGKRAGSPARKSDLNGGINTLW